MGVWDMRCGSRKNQKCANQFCAESQNSCKDADHVDHLHRSSGRKTNASMQDMLSCALSKQSCKDASHSEMRPAILDQPNR
jgi:hypothetical protein